MGPTHDPVVRVASSGGHAVALDAERVVSLQQRSRGGVLLRGDPGYDDARTIWNAMIDRQPALIARCAGVADVLSAVAFAREHQLLVSVRGGGHNVAGNAVCEGGLMIDLSPMRGIRVDPRARTARVQAGALWGDLDHETQAFGLATPGGIVSTTGVSGLTLGGGFGWLSRLHGLAADNLLSVDVVTAAGELVTASAAENAELFWGVRGGSGNFGVVTELELRLHPVGPEILFGPTLYRLEDAASVLRNYRERARRAPDECTVYADLLTAPPLPFLPPEHHGTRVLSIIQCYVGDLRRGDEVLGPFRDLGRAIGDAVLPRPYVQAQSLSDGLYAYGARNYWKSHNFKELTDEAIDVLVDCAARLPTDASDILIHQLGGAIQKAAPDATAYAHRETGFVVTPGGRWQEPAQDDFCMAWVRACHDALAGHAAAGSYVNFLGHDEAVARVRAAYGEGNYERLVALKARYDPQNLFRMNQNVPPSTR